MNAYTTIEESKQLIEAGLDVDTADMHYIKCIRDTDIVYIPELLYDDPLSEIDYPCWSLAALIDLIPEGIHWYLDENGLTIAEVDYYKDGKEVYVFRELYRNPVDAIVWLLKNNYIKSNKNE